VELIPGLAPKRPPPVAPDLAADAEPTQKAERPPGDPGARKVEVERDLAPAAEVNAPRGVEEGRELRKAIAFSARGDPRELAADIL
jgi:hypothetical protein